MTPVMLNVPDLWFDLFCRNLKMIFKFLLQRRNLLPVLQAHLYCLQATQGVTQQEQKFPSQFGSGIASDRDVIHLVQRHPCFFQTECYGVRWKPCPMLYSSEAFLFG